MSGVPTCLECRVPTDNSDANLSLGLGKGILEIRHFPLMSWDTADPLYDVGPGRLWDPSLPRLEAAT